MKKVLILNTTLNKGGAARVAHDLHKSLGSDFEMFFAYGRGKKDSDSKTFYFGNKLEMFIHIFLVRFLGLEGFGSYFSTKRLIKFIQNEGFNLINIHNLHGYYLNFFTLLKFLKESRIPIVYSLHDEWPITWLPAHSLGCEHCKTGLGKCQNTYAYPKNYFPVFQKYMLKWKRQAFADQLNMSIVCPSLWLTKNIQRSFLGKFKISTIFNSIDTNVFRPSINKNELREKHNLPTNKKIILFSASNLNDKSKGIDHILETAKTLSGKDYLFIATGKGQINETPNIKNLGYIYDKKILSEIYALSDLFCFASSAETFLLSAAESLSCGVPVVGFDLPVVRELVNKDVGVLTENNSDALSKEIDSLLGNDSKLAQMGQDGRKLIEDNYSKEKFKSEYIRAYNDILKQNE